jgi:hypothetical protein
MSELLQRGLFETVAVGAAALWLALAIALVVAWTSRTTAETLKTAVPTALVVLAVQSLHFTEQFGAFYQDRFFGLIGRHQWPDRLFVTLNMGWIAVWALACAGALRGQWTYPVATMLWFLCIAALLNSAVSPLLAIATLGYFPGLITAVPLALAGLALLRRLRA